MVTRRAFLGHGLKLALLGEVLFGKLAGKVRAGSSPRTYGSGLYGRGTYPLPPPSLSATPQTAAQINAEGFRLTVQGAPATQFVLDASEDLRTWTPVLTNQITAPATNVGVVDSSAQSRPRRFYRVEKLN